MDALPHWPEGTVAVLTTHPAHAIPVSLALRAGDRSLVIGLAPRRRSLELLRADARCAITVLARGIAFTAHGRAVSFSDPDPVVAVRIEVDFLARVDGTEFAMVLPGCGLGEACDVLVRVREATPRGQTASAGVARWDGEEPAELFLARAQDALAAAKSTGRNVTIAAD